MYDVGCLFIVVCCSLLDDCWLLLVVCSMMFSLFRRLLLVVCQLRVNVFVLFGGLCVARCSLLVVRC